jgi:hypothetical protein
VTPPASDIQIVLEVIQSSPAEPVPNEVLGDWQDPTYITERYFDLYNPATGYWLNEYDDQGGSGIRFTADGRDAWCQ